MIRTDELLRVVTNCLAWRVVEELVYVIDDMRADEDKATKVAAVNTPDCYWWTVHLVIGQVLQKLHILCVYIISQALCCYVRL